MNGFIKSSLIISIGNLLNKAFAMLFFVLIAKKITPDEYGQLRYLIAISFMYALPITGVSSALTKYIGNNIKILQEIKEYASNALILTSVIFIVIVLLIYSHIENWNLLVLLLAAAIIDSYYIAFINGLSNYTKMFLYKTIQNVFQFIVLFILYLSSIDFKINSIIFLYTISCFFSILVLEIFSSELKLTRVYSAKKIFELTKFGLLAMLGSVSWTVMFGVNMIWLKSFHGMDDVANYSVAETIASIFGILSSAISAIILPKIAEDSNSQKYIKPIIMLIILYVGSSLIFLVPIIIFKSQIISTIFSYSYIGAVDVLLPISISAILISIHVILSAVYFGISRPIIPAITISVGCFSNIILSYFLVKSYGAIGGGYSNLISSLIALSLIFIHFIILCRDNKRC